MKIEGISAIGNFLKIYEAIEQLDRDRTPATTTPPSTTPATSRPSASARCAAANGIPPWPKLWWQKALRRLPRRINEDACRLAETIQSVVDTDAWLVANPPKLEWFEGQFASAETPADHPLIHTLSAQHRQIRRRGSRA
ncbi:MAG: hypothetical protein R2856_16930 [Caldilineaceae bacterium]